MSDPSINAGRLYERTSAKGNVYLVGYLGPVRLVAFKSKETDDRGNPIWNLTFAEAPPRDKPAGDDVAKGQSQRPVSKPPARAASSLDDEIPF